MALTQFVIPLAMFIAATSAVINVRDSYSYSYAVGDVNTGDFKSHQESRSGGLVRGSYSLLEPGGTWRIVEYTADPIQGFRAVVHRRAPGPQGALNTTTTTPRSTAEPSTREASTTEASTTTHAPNNLGDFAAVMFSTRRTRKKLPRRRQLNRFNRTTV